jgi:ribosomal RNA-processing protein 1
MSEQNDLIKRLAHNEKAVRDKAVATVSKWLAVKPQIEETDLLKLWKGMFYCTQPRPSKFSLYPG